MRFAGAGLAILAAGWAQGVAAGDPAPFPDFTFKKGTPPKATAKKRITVQITAEEFAAQGRARSNGGTSTEEEEPVSAETPGEAGVIRAAGLYDWFWDTVPTGVSESGALRLESALIRLGKPPAGEAAPQFRLQTLQKIAAAQGQHILAATVGTEVSPALVLAVIAVESGGRADALSSAGAQGLMQLIPDTATRFGVTDSLEPGQNIKGGVAYLDWLLKEFAGDPILALAGYNAGENAVKTHAGVPPYGETRDYVPKVLAAYDVARGLCKTRPQFITDGCALNIAMK
ncbi:lytic transglycosylase domain-containing protein [Roseovarius sp. SCSIO 43702]|nr:lytic transglycosylase domain-containing protein [Roseovarius sp. SCSIO 43702]